MLLERELRYLFAELARALLAPLPLRPQLCRRLLARLPPCALGGERHCVRERARLEHVVVGPCEAAAALAVQLERDVERRARRLIEYGLAVQVDEVLSKARLNRVSSRPVCGLLVWALLV